MVLLRATCAFGSCTRAGVQPASSLPTIA